MMQSTGSHAPATLGIDLASQPENTAVCVIRWLDDRAHIEQLARYRDADGQLLDDQHLLSLMLAVGGSGRPAKIGIDAPLGWPVDFVRAVTDLDAWPVPADTNRLVRRATDWWVREQTGKLPLSVTTDRIAYAALRAAGLLRAYADHTGEEIDRSGRTGAICEVYPAPALTRFEIRLPGPALAYKGAAGGPERERLVRSLRGLAPWLEFSDDAERLCIESDHGLDAVVCALVARAAMVGLTDGPGEWAREAETEGWIHVPNATIERLAPAVAVVGET